MSNVTSAVQVRAARALLGIKQPELAAASGLGLSTILDFEKGRRHIPQETVEVILAALRKAGIEFIPENGGGAGVRLKRKAKR